MAISNRDRVGRAFEQLAAGLKPYVERRMTRMSPLKEAWFETFIMQAKGLGPDAHLDDPAVLLRVLADCWDLAFKQELSRTTRNVVFALRDRRNSWAHNAKFTFDDTYRALDEVEQLLTTIDAPQADAIAAEKVEYRRAQDEIEAKRTDPAAAIGGAVKGLRPWREVVQPHDDVAQGRYSKAEFAADLHQVVSGKGAAEYVNPVEFFRRTYLTEGLRQLLVEAVRRVGDNTGSPVVDLQTNFGGGKTHSMIALYHLFSGMTIKEIPSELASVLKSEGVKTIAKVPRAVLHGVAMKPGQPSIKDDGTVVRTMWGELAWQLGGREAFDLLAQADATSTSPGDALDDVFRLVGPCVVLIDEWVAYARQLYSDDTLPAGTFPTHFAFAQALTESARRSTGVLLVVSIPASGSPDDSEDAVGSELEVGGFGGKQALLQLRNVIGRLESSWRPATAEESFEIVRRRLFKPMDDASIADRDAVAQAFADYYRKQAAELPDAVRSPRYMDQIKAAYPIHPELFERLYEDWSTLERFQRTRGVLRLMAGVINALWEGGDQSPLIMPASVPLDRSSVASELLRNLEDNFKPVLDADIDGEGATSRDLDRDFPNLGKYQAARRVARAVFLGSAPTLKSANRGVEAQRIRLACALPGETIETYGDALKRLSDRASYLYVEGSRYWFDTRQSIVRQAQEDAELFRTRKIDEVHVELVERLKLATRDRGQFGGVHVAPRNSEDVGDDDVIRLVVLGPDQQFIEKAEHSGAKAAATEILERRGTSPRQRRNMVVFLAPDQRSLEHLEQAAAEYLAWKRIVDDADARNLDKFQERQAGERCRRADDVIGVQLSETYKWLLVPTQGTEQGAPVAFTEFKLDGSTPLAKRASDRLEKEGLLYMRYPPVLLRTILDGPLASVWEDGHVGVGALWELFAQYPYLPKLRDSSVLVDTVREGPNSTTWQTDGFAVADVDQGTRYGGLHIGEIALSASNSSLIVQPAAALGQIEQEEAEARSGEALDDDEPGDDEAGESERGIQGKDAAERIAAVAEKVTRFQGSVDLDMARPVKQFQQVADEILINFSHGTVVKVTVEIEALCADGFDENTVRNINENARVLKFDAGSGFEKD